MVSNRYHNGATRHGISHGLGQGPQWYLQATLNPPDRLLFVGMLLVHHPLALLHLWLLVSLFRLSCADDIVGSWHFAYPPELDALQTANHGGNTTSTPYYPESRIRHASTLAFPRHEDPAGRIHQDTLFFIFGGLDSLGTTYLSDAWVYDVEAPGGSWTLLTLNAENMGGRADARAVTMPSGSPTFVYGGLAENFDVYRNAFVWFGGDLSHSQLSGTSFFEHRGPVVLPRVAPDEGFVVLCGCDPVAFSCDVEVYDAVTDAFTVLSTANMPETYHAMGWMRYVDEDHRNSRGDQYARNATIYLFGGNDGSDVVLSTMWKLNLHHDDNIEWTIVGNEVNSLDYGLTSTEIHPGPRLYHSCTSLFFDFFPAEHTSKFAWCYGGQAQVAYADIFRGLWRFDMDSETWAYLPEDYGQAPPLNDPPVFVGGPPTRPGSRLLAPMFVLVDDEEEQVVVSLMGGLDKTGNSRLDYWSWTPDCFQDANCWQRPELSCSCPECQGHAACDLPPTLCETFVEGVDACYPDYCACDPCVHLEACPNGTTTEPPPDPSCMPEGQVCFASYCKCETQCGTDETCVNNCASLNIASCVDNSWCWCSTCGLAEDCICHPDNPLPCYPDRCECTACESKYACREQNLACGSRNGRFCAPDFCHCGDCTNERTCECLNKSACFPNFCDCGDCADDRSCQCLDKTSCHPDFCDCDGCADDRGCQCSNKTACYPDFCDCGDCVDDRSCQCSNKTACCPDFCDCDDCANDRSCECLNKAEECSPNFCDCDDCANDRSCECLNKTACYPDFCDCDGCEDDESCPKQAGALPPAAVAGIAASTSILGLIVLAVVVVVVVVVLCNRRREKMRKAEEDTAGVPSELLKEIEVDWYHTKDEDGSVVPAVRMSLRRGSVKPHITEMDIKRVLKQSPHSAANTVLVEVLEEKPEESTETKKPPLSNPNYGGPSAGAVAAQRLWTEVVREEVMARAMTRQQSRRMSMSIRKRDFTPLKSGIESVRFVLDDPTRRGIDLIGFQQSNSSFLSDSDIGGVDMNVMQGRGVVQVTLDISDGTKMIFDFKDQDHPAITRCLSCLLEVSA